MVFNPRTKLDIGGWPKTATSLQISDSILDAQIKQLFIGAGTAAEVLVAANTPVIDASMIETVTAIDCSGGNIVVTLPDLSSASGASYTESGHGCDGLIKIICLLMDPFPGANTATISGTGFTPVVLDALTNVSTAMFMWQGGHWNMLSGPVTGVSGTGTVTNFVFNDNATGFRGNVTFSTTTPTLVLNIDETLVPAGSILAVQDVAFPLGKLRTAVNGDFGFLQITNSQIVNGTIDLTTKVTGVLPVTNGGTGNASWLPYAVITGGTGATTALQHVSSLGSAGQVLTSAGAGALPTWTTISVGTGTVTSVSVVSANGFGGSVATATTTPAITLTTTVAANKMIKSNGTGIVAATAGSDYSPALDAYVPNSVVVTEAVGPNLTSISAGTSGFPLLSGGGGSPVAFGALDLATTAVTGTLGVGNGGTGNNAFTGNQLVVSNAGGTLLQSIGSYGTSGQVLASNGPGLLPVFVNLSTLTGFLTTIAFSGATASNGVAASVVNSPPTATITLGTNVTGMIKGAAGAFTAAVPNVDYLTGIVPVTNGGTGLSALASGSMLYGSGSSPMNTLAIGANGRVLTVSAGAPSWQLTDVGNVTGVLSIAHGGTNNTSFAANQVVIADGTGSSLTTVATGTTTGQVLSFNVGGAPTWITPVAGSVTIVSVTSANGFSGTVATATTTPAITLNTTVTAPVLKGSGGAIVAATAGTDYSPFTAPYNLNSVVVTGPSSPSLTSIAVGTAGQALLSNGGVSAPAFGLLNVSNAVTGVLPLANGGTNSAITSGTFNNTLLIGNSSSTAIVPLAAGVGTSGFFLRSNGAGADPSWASATIAIPITVSEGGTGVTTLTPYAPLVGGTSSTSAVQSASSGQSNVGYVFTSLGTGVGAVPTWQPINLSTLTSPLVTGTLPVTNGGTGVASFTANQVVIANTTSTGALTQVAAGTSGQVLTSQGAAAPIWTTASGGTVTSVSVTSGNGFAGTVATATTTPAITMRTTITSAVLGGSLGSLVAASAGLDYAPPVTAVFAANSLVVTGAASSTPLGTVNTATVGLPLISQGTSTLPIYSALSLSGVGVTGVLPVANGGTGDSTLTAYAVLCGGTTTTGPMQQVSGLGTSGQVLTSNGAAALPTWQAASGSVANWTSGQSAAAPYLGASHTTAIWTANSTTAAPIEDATITPVSTGAFILGHFADNSATGGNIRGQSAVDLQMNRSLNTQVASGNFSINVGGRNNTALGLTSLAGGDTSRATGVSSFSFGASCLSSADYAISMGISCTASSQNAIAMGNNCQATANGAIAMGQSCNADTAGSVTLGSINSQATSTACVISGGRNQIMSGGFYNVIPGGPPCQVTNVSACYLFNGSNLNLALQAANLGPGLGTPTVPTGCYAIANADMWICNTPNGGSSGQSGKIRWWTPTASAAGANLPPTTANNGWNTSLSAPSTQSASVDYTFPSSPVAAQLSNSALGQGMLACSSTGAWSWAQDRTYTGNSIPSGTVITAGTATVFAFTCTGASTGDVVSIGMGQPATAFAPPSSNWSNCLFSGYVSAIDSVSVIVQNFGGTAVTLNGAANVKIRVSK